MEDVHSFGWLSSRKVMNSDDLRYGAMKWEGFFCRIFFVPVGKVSASACALLGAGFPVGRSPSRHWKAASQGAASQGRLRAEKFFDAL